MEPMTSMVKSHELQISKH